MITLNINRRINSVVIAGDEDDSCDAMDSAKLEAFIARKNQEFEAMQGQVRQLAAALNTAAGQMNDLLTNVVADNQQQIGHLAIEIAKKILGKEIEERRYDIKGIISTMLEAAPTLEKATLKLNPEDYASLNKAGPNEVDAMMENLKIESDWSIQPAECVLETPKGIIEYMVGDQLQRLSEAFISSQ